MNSAAQDSHVTKTMLNGWLSYSNQDWELVLVMNGAAQDSHVTKSMLNGYQSGLGISVGDEQCSSRFACNKINVERLPIRTVNQCW